MDADGNEISAEEEEELERHRAEYRLQAAQARANMGYFGRLRPPMHGTVLDSVNQINDHVIPRRSRAVAADKTIDYPPFVVDPLPMPLDKMVSTPTRHQDEKVVIFVPMHASFAGR